MSDAGGGGGGPIDPNRIIAELFTNLLKDSAKLTKDATKAIFQKLIDLLKKDLQSYLTGTIQRCSVVKTILHREEPAKFWSLYVAQKLKCRSRVYDDFSMLPALFEMKSAIIEGSAGSGKSMFMRYLFLMLCKQPMGKMPLFIELRHVNSLQTKDLFSFLYHSIQKPGGVLTKDQFTSGLENGLFAIILDGFDEIDFDQRNEVEKQILDLREKYPGIVIIVSSRPDERFHAWSHFYIVSVLPMEKSQISELIGKLDYDADTTDKFLAALESGLFAEHISFLSNPLLAIMMLITFDQYAHIPDKIHIFYEHAFDALFSRHDSSKPGVYKRRTYSGLPIDDFKNVLSSFSMATYAQELFHFGQTEVRNFLRKAIVFERKDVGKAERTRVLDNGGGPKSICAIDIRNLRSVPRYFYSATKEPK